MLSSVSNENLQLIISKCLRVRAAGTSIMLGMEKLRIDGELSIVCMMENIVIIATAAIQSFNMKEYRVYRCERRKT
jgi:hypothetical protein